MREIALDMAGPLSMALESGVERGVPVEDLEVGTVTSCSVVRLVHGT